MSALAGRGQHLEEMAMGVSSSWAHNPAKRDGDQSSGSLSSGKDDTGDGLTGLLWVLRCPLLGPGLFYTHCERLMKASGWRRNSLGATPVLTRQGSGSTIGINTKVSLHIFSKNGSCHPLF